MGHEFGAKGSLCTSLQQLSLLSAVRRVGGMEDGREEGREEGSK